MFLSKDSVKAEIITAKSSEMNVMIPTDDDYVITNHNLLDIITLLMYSLQF